MASRPLLLGILILLVTVSAAPSDVSKTEDIPTLDKTEKLEPLEENEENLTQAVRQKRFYNYLNFGVPPINPAFYPPRDFSSEIGPYVDDPLLQIHKRLQDIADSVKQPAPPPSLPFAFFYPVIFVPQYSCNCLPENSVTSTQSPLPNSTSNGTIPDIENRVPVLEDERQNWGLVVNENDADDDEDLNTRPISFDPIKAVRPMARPPPRVDHGSRQADSGNILTTTTLRPPPPPPPSPAVASVASFGRPPPPLRAPNTCEKAVLSCCHQTRVTYECFVSQGCPNLSSITLGNPCDPSVIVRVIDLFQNYYGQRNGL